MKAKGRKPKVKQPSIRFYSLGDANQFDYMPHLNTASSLPENQRKIITSMKNGTYTPFMASIAYKADVKKNLDLISAEPATDIFNSTDMDKWDFSADVKQKKTQGGQSRLESLTKQYENVNTPVMPRYFHNPLQYFDHILLADAYVNSFGGTVVDMYTDFIMPKKLKPILKLRNPDAHGNPEEQQKLIEANQKIIESLNEVDNWYSDIAKDEQDKLLDIPLMAKFKASIINHLVFGRCAIIKEHWDGLPHFTCGDKEYKDIPNALKVMNPIDMGIIELDYLTWKLGGIYIYNQVPFIPASKMIYLVNKFTGPQIGSMYYGFSVLQRAIDPIRLLRRIFAQNYPQFIRTSHSGMGYFLFDSTGYPEDIRDSIRTQIVNSYKAGEIGVIDYANIKDFEYKEVKITPEIDAMIHLQESLIKVIIGIVGMPQSLIFDEAAATRSTLVGRIVSFINNQITQLRSSIGDQFASQWYMPNFRILYKDDEKKLEMFTIGVEFEEMDLETKTEKVERLILETQLNQYKNEYIGEELGDASYLDHIDEAKNQEKAQSQMGDPFGKMPVKPTGNKGVYKVTDADTGKVSRVESANK